MHPTPDAATAAITPEGELLDTLYGRLVRWHYTIAESAARVPPETQATMMREMMATLREIAENPGFRAASAAREPKPPRPVDEARIARLRAKAAAGLEAKGLTP